MTRTRIIVVGFLILLAGASVWLGWILWHRAQGSSIATITCVRSSGPATVLRCGTNPTHDAALEYSSTALVSVGTALLGAAVILVLVDWLLGGLEDKSREARREARRLDDLTSRVRAGGHDDAATALDELRRSGALVDGTLSGRSLSGASLEAAQMDGAVLTGVDLTGADLRHARLVSSTLRKADLVGAQLSGANLCWADLTAAIVTEQQLRSVDMLWNAILPDGMRYDGRYALSGDTDYARELGIDLGDANAIALFYGRLS